MRKYFYLTLATLVAIAAGTLAARWATRAEPTQLPETNPTPETFTFALDEPPILSRGEAVFSVRITNSTADTVQLTQSQVSCACTAVTLDSAELAPGQETLARLRVQLRGRFGNERFRNEWVDQLERVWAAEVRVPIELPEEFVPQSKDWGTVAPGQELRTEVNFRQVAPTIEELPPVPEWNVTGDGVVATPGVARTEPLGPRLVVRTLPMSIAIRVPDTAGRGKGQVMPAGPVDLINRPPFLSLYWDVPSVVDLYPAQAVFVLRNDEPQFELKRTVVLRPKPGTQITGATSPDPRVKLTLRPETNGASALDISVKPAEFRDSCHIPMTVQTNHTGVATITTSVSILRPAGSKK